VAYEVIFSVIAGLP